MPSSLCRLRYLERRGWTLAIYTYSNEKYEPSIFSSGKWDGTPEEALDMEMDSIILIQSGFNPNVIQLTSVWESGLYCLI